MPFEVKFQNGRTATFQNRPTDSDIDEVASRMGIGQPTGLPSTPAPTGVRGLPGVTTGFAKAGLETIQGLGQLGLRGAELVTGREKGAFGSQETFFRDPQALQRRGGAEKIGGALEIAAEFAVPVTKVAKIPTVAKGITTTARGIRATPGTIAEVALGSERKRAALAGLKNPELQRRVLNRQITTETLAEKASQLFLSQREKGIKTLQLARKKIIGTNEVVPLVNNLNKAMEASKITTPLVQTREIKNVNEFVKFLRRNLGTTGNVTKKELDTLVQNIDKAGFFKRDTDIFGGSNKLVNAVRKILRAETKIGNPKFEKLLKQSSEKDIRFFTKLGEKVLDRQGNIDMDKAQRAINQVVNSLDDPNRVQNAVKLLRELVTRAKDKSGFLDELQAFADSKVLLKEAPGALNIFRAAEQRAGQLLSKTARGVGGLLDRTPTQLK